MKVIVILQYNIQQQDQLRSPTLSKKKQTPFASYPRSSYSNGCPQRAHLSPFPGCPNSFCLSVRPSVREWMRIEEGPQPTVCMALYEYEKRPAQKWWTGAVMESGVFCIDTPPFPSKDGRPMQSGICAHLVV